MNSETKPNEMTISPTQMGRMVGVSRQAIQDKICQFITKPKSPGKYSLEEVLQFLWGKLNEKPSYKIQDESELPPDKISKEEAQRRMTIEKLEKTKLENELTREALISKPEVIESIRELAQINRRVLEDFLINQLPKKVVGMMTVGEIRSVVRPLLNSLLENIDNELDKYVDPQGDSDIVEIESQTT